MLLKKPHLIAFDLDGTLVDSALDIALSVNLTLQQLNLSEHAEEKIRHWIGNGVEKLIHRALTDSEDKEAEPAIFTAALRIFKTFYAENMCNRSQVYPGVIEALEYLKSHHIKLSVITNKPAMFTEDLLKTLHLFDYFGLVISGDTLDKKKPDPMPLLHTAKYFGLSSDKCLMVGDSTNDVFAAKAAGFQVLCVDYGYNRGIDIRESNPDRVVSSLATIKELI